jgi:peroxiredoxin
MTKKALKYLNTLSKEELIEVLKVHKNFDKEFAMIRKLAKEVFLVNEEAKILHKEIVSQLTTSSKPKPE